MTIAPETITVALHKLCPCSDNVRKTGAAEGIDELKANIAAIGLLHPLTVRKTSRGRFAVVAGQRRLLALTALAEEGAITKDEPVACHLLSKEADAVEVSLAENAVRLPMHPADQFDAFAALIDKGTCIADVAARFGVSDGTVRKRLKLAQVSPVILAAYREDKLSLDQVAAFAASDDRRAQERFYAERQPWHSSAAQIRAALTQDEIAAIDRRVQFVSLAAYEAAGGAVRRDLFSEGDEGVFIADSALLDRLVCQKLQQEADAVRAEGWKWVEVRDSFDYEARFGFSCRHPESEPLTEEQAGELEALREEYDALTEQDEEDGDIAARLSAIEIRIAELEDSPCFYTPETLAISGAVVTLDHHGELDIFRGLIRPEDEPEPQPDAVRQAAAPKSAFSAALIESLTAQKSAAIGAALADNPDVVLAAVTHALALRVFIMGDEGSLQLTVTRTRYREASQGREALEQARLAWLERIPTNAAALWDWCLAQNRETLLSLLAFCAGSAVNAVQMKQDGLNCYRLAHANALRIALALDMMQWFTPTAANFFNRVSRPIILEALGEAKGQKPLRSWEKLKKSELAALAEGETTGTGWLPEPLRFPASAQA